MLKKLKKLFREHGRHRASEFIIALNALEDGELARGVAELFTAGELRLHSRKRKEKAGNLCSRFQRYDAANPQVARWFLGEAQALKQKRERYGIGALMEDVRWKIHLGIIKTSRFSISNDLGSCYARLVIMRDPNLCGFFDLKPSAADSLIVDGRAWTDFAEEHESQLKPERNTKKKATCAEPPELPLKEKA